MRSVSGAIVDAAVRTRVKARGRSRSATLTGDTSVMCGAMRSRASSPSARRTPSISVASGCGTSSTTPSRCLAIAAG